MVQCCFTSTETARLIRTAAQEGHLGFHTAPELCEAGTIMDLYNIGSRVQYNYRCALPRLSTVRLSNCFHASVQPVLPSLSRKHTERNLSPVSITAHLISLSGHFCHCQKCRMVCEQMFIKLTVWPNEVAYVYSLSIDYRGSWAKHIYSSQHNHPGLLTEICDRFRFYQNLWMCDGLAE